MSERGWSCRAVRARRNASLPLREALPGPWVGDTWASPVRWPRVDLILVAVPDHGIREVAGRLAEGDDCHSAVVLHTSGLRTSEDLAPCHASGAAVGSWHPLQTFPALGRFPVSWEGVYCAIEGDPPAVEIGEALARELDLIPWRIQVGDKLRYHAAASVAGNLTHALVVAAKEMLASTGIEPHAAGEALKPLVRASLEAALAARGFEGVTGPLTRGDSKTIAAHLAALSPPVADAYRAIVRLVTNRNLSDKDD